jgi:hypothetical protein
MPKRGKSLRKRGRARPSRVPGLVKLISILYYIGAISGVIIGVVFILGGIIGDDIVNSIGIDQLILEASNLNILDAYILNYIQSALLMGGILLTIISLIGIYVARGLWKGQNWARIVVIVLSVLGFLGALFEFDLITLVLSGVIGAYLIWSKNVKATFK